MVTTVFFLKEADFFRNSIEFHVGSSEKHQRLAQTLIEQGAYEKMAEVAGTPEDAFRLMQNGLVTDSWSLVPPLGLTVLNPAETLGHRSMTVGDIVVVDGEISICAPLGFEPIGICSEAIAQKLVTMPTPPATPSR